MLKKDRKKDAATQADVDSGKAAFWVPENRSKAYDLGFPLPAQAVIRKGLECKEGEEPIPAGTFVTVVQAEIVDGSDVLIGFTYEGGQGVCAFDEIEFSI